MITTLDIGNGHPNYCVFQNQQLLKKELLVAPINLTSDDVYICSKVGNLDETKFILGGRKLQMPEVVSQTNTTQFLNMPVRYSESLGQDRLCTAYCYYSQSSGAKQSSLILDAGTFLTVDLVDTHLGFCGGYILPGLKLYFNSYARGDKLPVLNPSLMGQLDLEEIPHDTNTAIFTSYLFPLKTMLTSLILKYQPNQILLTGGDAAALSKVLEKENKISNLIAMKPDLLHWGLLAISETIMSAKSPTIEVSL